LRRCNTIGNYGIYLWTAGKRVNPKTESEFAWQVVWKTKTQIGSATYKMDYTHWNITQPDFGNSKEACVNLWVKYGYHWNEEPCDHKYCFICENQYAGIP